MATTTFKNNMVVTGALTVDGATTFTGASTFAGNATITGTFIAEGGMSQAGTATAVAEAATLNGVSGKITTEALTTAQNLFYTLTLTNSSIAAADGLIVTVGNGTNTQGTPMVATATPGAGTATILIQNKHATAQALNGTLTVTFMVLKA